MKPSTLETTLKQLRLSGLGQTLSVRLQEAAANRLSHGEFLELNLQDELNVRQQRLLARRTQAAEFHALKPLEDFDWSFNPSIHRKEFSNWPRASSFVRLRTCCSSARRAWGKPHSLRVSATKPS